MLFEQRKRGSHSEPRQRVKVTWNRHSSWVSGLSRGNRQSGLSLIMTSRELAAEMRRRYSSEPGAQNYFARLHSLAEPKPGFTPR